MTRHQDAHPAARRERELRERALRLEERVVQLEIERDAARAANRARSRFFAQLSHELRTPLDAVIGMTDAALRGPLEEAQHRRLIEVLLAAETLLGVVNDLLDYARIEADDAELERVPFDLHDLVFDTVAPFAKQAEALGVAVACGIDPALPALLVGDPGRLRQVLAVLVRNAVRFTERGEVGVQVALRSRDDELRLEVEVRDTGTGIEADRVAALFDARRAEPGTAAPVVGLPLCRKLVERMGGEIRVESVPGSGSTFSFGARVEVTEGVHDRHRRAPKPLAGAPVLIADAHEASARVLEVQTRGWGMEPTTAANAKDALGKLHAALAAGGPLPLLLLDAQLPTSGGLEFVEQIRGDVRFESLVAVLLHAGARPASAELARRLSIAAQLPKPVQPVRLFDATTQALGIPLPPTPPRYRYRSAHDAVRLASPPPMTPAAPAWLPPSRILLVDDSPGSREVVKAILDDPGHAIEAVGGGREALERFRTGRFDVVLLDLQMPGMDGFEVCAAIRAREAGTGHRVPIVAMTANALRGDRERCLVAGMDHYVTKPVRRDDLFAALLAARQHDVAADPGPGRTASDAKVDWSAMEAMVDGNVDLMREVVQAYVVEIREHLERIPGEIDARDVSEARRRAHSLRGAMSTFGASDAEAITGRLEAATAAGDFATAATLFEHVRGAVGAVLPRLEAFLRDDGKAGR